eukprot:1173986-Rhodomonas_salina.6
MVLSAYARAIRRPVLTSHAFVPGRDAYTIYLPRSFFPLNPDAVSGTDMHHTATRLLPRLHAVPLYKEYQCPHYHGTAPRSICFAPESQLVQKTTNRHPLLLSPVELSLLDFVFSFDSIGSVLFPVLAFAVISCD